MEGIKVAARCFPSRVEVDWRRFSGGLWKVPQGDIRAACRLEALPEAKTFQHDGWLYVTCGMDFRGFLKVEANCHPIIRPEDYRGPEPQERGYEGRTVTVKRQSVRLGPQVMFVARDPTVAEWRQHLRILYTEGVVFASKPTYADFLDSLRELGSVNRIEATAKDRTELGNCTKDELRLVMNPAPVTSLDQLSFKW